jgi:putative tricarboxylic transport membrane protein
MFFGALPGAGGATSNFIAYVLAKEKSSNKDTFGTGNIEGVIAPEGCNNAGVGTVLIPTLVFGIPGSAAGAVILSLLMVHGIPIGLKLFLDTPSFVFTFFWGLLLTNLMLPFVVFPLLPLFTRITIVPYQLLVSSVAMLCITGAFAFRSVFLDILLACAGGVLGYFMQKGSYPSVCLILGLILGPLAEQNYARALQVFGSHRFLIERPICLTLAILIVALIFSPYIKRLFELFKIHVTSLNKEK